MKFLYLTLFLVLSNNCFVNAQLSVPFSSEYGLNSGTNGALFSDSRPVFFPIGVSEKKAKFFWEQKEAKLLTSTAIYAGPDFFSTRLIIASDIIGPLYVDIGISVVSVDQSDPDSTTTDSTELLNPSAERLIQGGGTVHISFSYPILFWTVYSGTDLRLMLAVITRFAGGWDSPRASELIKNPGLSGGISNELSVKVIGLTKSVGFEFGLRQDFYFYNDEFALRLSSSEKSSQILSLRGGIILFKQTRLGVIFPRSKSDVFEDIIQTRAYIQQHVNF